MAGEKDKGRTFKGNSHADGGIPIIVKGSGQQIEVEGNEPLISNEALQSNEIHEYSGSNFQILDKINKSCGAKGLSEAATEVYAGDVIICKATLRDNTTKTLKGTHKQIISAINTEAGCAVIEPGGTITDKNGTQQFKGGGKVKVIDKYMSDEDYEDAMKESRWEEEMDRRMDAEREKRKGESG